MSCVYRVGELGRLWASGHRPVCGIRLTFVTTLTTENTIIFSGLHTFRRLHFSGKLPACPEQCIPCVWLYLADQVGKGAMRAHCFLHSRSTCRCSPLVIGRGRPGALAGLINSGSVTGCRAAGLDRHHGCQGSEWSRHACGR